MDGWVEVPYQRALLDIALELHNLETMRSLINAFVVATGFRIFYLCRLKTTSVRFLHTSHYLRIDWFEFMTTEIPIRLTLGKNHSCKRVRAVTMAKLWSTIVARNMSSFHINILCTSPPTSDSVNFNTSITSQFFSDSLKQTETVTYICSTPWVWHCLYEISFNNPTIQRKRKPLLLLRLRHC